MAGDRLGTDRVRNPERGFVEVLFGGQMEQAATQAWVSVSIVGHQKRKRRKARVWVMPGCHVRWVECAHCRT